MEQVMEFAGRDRRLAERHEVKTPLRLRMMRSEATEQQAESANVSRRGVYFKTDLLLAEGAILDLLLEMPESITGVRAAQWVCLGHVVRVEEAKAASKIHGVGVEFDFYVVSHTTTPRWGFGPCIRGPLRP
jgi:hypothetical protein